MLERDGEAIHYDNPVANGSVRSWLTRDEVDTLMAQVAAFT